MDKRKNVIVKIRLEDDLYQIYPIVDSLGRTQNATFVNEAGMYEVVIRSDSPKAKQRKHRNR